MFGRKKKIKVSPDLFRAAMRALNEDTETISKLTKERDALKAEVARLKFVAPTDPDIVVVGLSMPQRVFVDGQEIRNVVSVTNDNEPGHVSRTTIVLHGPYSVRANLPEEAP